MAKVAETKREGGGCNLKKNRFLNILDLFVMNNYFFQNSFRAADVDYIYLQTLTSTSSFANDLVIDTNLITNKYFHKPNAKYS